MPLQANFDLNNKKKREDYQFRTKISQEESNSVQSFRSKLLAALDEVALSAIGTDDEQVTMKLEEIYEAFDLGFSTISASELKRELKKIREPITTISSFDSVIKCTQRSTNSARPMHLPGQL